jgi:hypothetical protein
LSLPLQCSLLLLLLLGLLSLPTCSQHSGRTPDACDLTAAAVLPAAAVAAAWPAVQSPFFATETYPGSLLLITSLLLQCGLLLLLGLLLNFFLCDQEDEATADVARGCQQHGVLQPHHFCQLGHSYRPKAADEVPANRTASTATCASKNCAGQQD